MSAAVRRVAVVTGAAGGLGGGIVAELARQGWSVAAGWHRQAPGGVEGDVVAVPLDVTDDASIQQAINGVLERWGRIDLLVNNAGIAGSKAALFGFTQSLSRELGSRDIRVNAISPGFLPTALVGDLTEAQRAVHASANTLGRLNDIAEVARFVAFLAGMRNVSGQVFQLDSRITPWS